MNPCIKKLEALLRATSTARGIGEKHLQNYVEQALQAADFPYKREWRASPKDIPDFFLPDTGIVIEVKQRATSADAQQLLRYALHDEVRELVIVTWRHTGDMIESFQIVGKIKRVTCIELWSQLL